jgi:ATP-dependent Clp protease adaptor protein ClpS
MNIVKEATTTKKAETNFAHKLVLLNDEHNTFEHVYNSLMEICGHTLVQAEQCTMIAHFTGKCVIKEGEESKLKDMVLAFVLRNISVVLSKEK